MSPIPISPRRRAVEQLVRVEEGRAFVGLIGASEEGTSQDARDERQTTEYVAGVTRWRRWLDFVLDQFYHGSVERVEPVLKQILRVGAYDLLMLGTPPHAAVNEAVSLAKSMVRPDAGRLANGVLRSLDRGREALAKPTGPEADRLAVRHSHPTWMVERWLGRLGREGTIALLQSNNARPIYGLRVNTLVGSPEDFRASLEENEIEYENSPFLSYFVRVRHLQGLFRTGLVAAGTCAIQDEGAGLVVCALDPQPGERILDLCAAPGGKALHAAQLMQNHGEVLAVDVNAARLRLVERAAAVQRVDVVRTLAADARTLDPAELGLWDRVLLDAPCSGLGVLAKRADLRWNRRVEDFTELVALQDALLEAAARLVRPGGVLVYATCSIEPVENEARVEAFLQRYPAFVPERPIPSLPDEVLSSEGFLLTHPPVHQTDGAFAALLRNS